MKETLIVYAIIPIGFRKGDFSNGFKSGLKIFKYVIFCVFNEKWMSCEACLLDSLSTDVVS